MQNEPLDRLLPRPADRQRIDTLLGRGWSLFPPGGGPGNLQGQRLGPVNLLALVGPKNNVGASYFQLFLIDQTGRLSQQPLALGLWNSGRYPAYNWVDFVHYDAGPAFEGDALDLADTDLDQPLFQRLGQALPPGGHLMVEYESPTQRATERMLSLGYPPACSPLGLLLLTAGCLSFRDWYISEGGREGPRKLQGFKPLNEAHAKQRLVALNESLGELLAKPSPKGHGDWDSTARRLAERGVRAAQARLDRPGDWPVT